MMVTIRKADAGDAAAVASLSGELGYPVSEVDIGARLRRINEMPDHTVLVACAPDGVILGWADVGVTFHLQSGSYAEIGGLVVTASARRGGIGKELVARAEEWAFARGVKRMVVRCNAVREEAHRFYLREGYQQTKTSAIFEKRFRSGE